MIKINYQKIIQLNLFVFLLIGIFLVCNKTAQAADFYVDPINGDMSNDGSQVSPWSTMQAVLDNCKVHSRRYRGDYSTQVPTIIDEVCPDGVVEPGDTIYLMDGYQGALTVMRFLNEGNITVKAYPGQTPTFKNIDILGSSYWTFDGITVSPEFATPYTVWANGIIQIENHSNTGPCDHITIKNSTVYSVSNDLTSWPTLLDWFEGSSRGIVSDAHYCTFENNTIRNTEGCVAINNSNFVTIKNNFCNYQSGDVLGISNTDDLLIEGNILTNIIPASEVYEDTHPDMMQFSSLDGSPDNPMYRITIRGNYVHANLDYGVHPLMSPSGNGRKSLAFRRRL